MEHSSPRGFLFRKPSVNEAEVHASVETAESLLPSMSRSPRSLSFERNRAYDQSPRHLQSEAVKQRAWGSWQPESAQPQYANELLRQDFPSGLQPRDPSADILVLRIHCITSISPLRNPPSAYTIIPCAETGDRAGGAIAGQPIGRYRAERDVMTPGCFAIKVDSDVLRYYAGPNSLFYFKILEDSETRSDMFGMVTLSGLPETILSDPTVLPERIINQPAFRLVYPIDGIDGNTRGEMTVSALYDFARPGECPWPNPESHVAKAQLQQRMRVVAAAQPYSSPPPLLQIPPRRRVSRTRQTSFGETLLEDLRAFCMTLPDTFC